MLVCVSLAMGIVHMRTQVVSSCFLLFCKYEASGQWRAPAFLWQVCICQSPVRKQKLPFVFKIEETEHRKLVTQAMKELRRESENQESA